MTIDFGELPSTVEMGVEETVNQFWVEIDPDREIPERSNGNNAMHVYGACEH